MADAPATSSLPDASPLVRLGRHRGLIFPVGCIGLLAVLLVPLPAPLLDLLLVVNLTISVLLMVTAIHVRSPLEFAVLPSLLLTVTLFRLTLNVATTRLILTAGANGAGAQESLAGAGQVVQSFASLVTAGSLAVGLIIFLIIFVIQFVVITKGATRISEVAARFTLDAMPGRQMAIDADLNAGVIDEQEARRRRDEIGQQADFYGAMDGASKFVRGDAIAGILITFVNILGGMYVGLVDRGWGVAETAELFTRLTIGDGLVSQVPAFIVALGCGLMVTRSGAKAELGEQVASQLLSNTRPLWIVSAFLVCLSVTGLPPIPMLTLAAGCGGLAWLLGRQAAQRAQEAPPLAAAALPTEQPVEVFLDLEAIELEVGRGLIRLASRERGGDLLEHIADLRRVVASELGLIVPPVRVRDNPARGPNEYNIRIRGMSVGRGEAYPDQFLAVRGAGARQPLPHAMEQVDPASRLPAYWITEPQRDEARQMNYALFEASEALAAHLGAVIRQHAHALLSRQEVRNLLEHLKKTAPALVEEVIGPQVKPGELQRVLQSLLREGVPIRDMETILETLSEAIPRTRNIDDLTEHCRAALARTLCRLHADETDTLHCITLDPALEEFVYAHLHRGEHGTTSSIPPQAVQSTVERIADTLSTLTAAGRRAVVLCAPQIRVAIRRMLEGPLPQVAVLGYNEVIPEFRLEAASMVGLES